MRRRATTGVDGTRGVGFCFFFGGRSSVGGGGALLLFVLRACCRGMCWPGDRPGTHAAAGAAARGGFNSLRGATTGEGVKEFP